jgi:hypothetical protein
MLLEAWIEDAIACCEKCGVTPPAALMSEREIRNRQDNEPVAGTSNAVQLAVVEEMVCAV